MKRIRIDESEKQRILGMHHTAIKRQYLSENLDNVVGSFSPDERQRYNMAIQCFLNKRGITDNDGNKLAIDGSIGNYPKSKSAQAIHKYQEMVKTYPVDGKWGDETVKKMPPNDKKMFEECISEYKDIFDRIIDFFR